MITSLEQDVIPRFDVFVGALCKKRNDAIAGRMSSGIEQDWLEDEEYYQGIDNANRGIVRSRGGDKPSRVLMIGQTKLPNEENRSVVFVNITRPYVDAAAARLADMLLPVDDDCFHIKATPIAEISRETIEILKQSGIQWSQIQDGIQTSATVAADLMEMEISDHLEECGWHGEVRSVIEDASRIGTGVLKGPFPQKQTLRKWTVVEGQGILETVDEVQPGSKRIDPWNFFPDPSCGENIHNGSYTFERSYVTPKQIREMAKMPGYDAGELARVLKDGPRRVTSPQPDLPTDNTYEMWTFYGIIADEDAVAAGLEISDLTMVNVMALLINDRLVKIDHNVIDTGEYPYDLLAWQRRSGIPWGTGVGGHIRTPQKMLNASCRAMMDNAGMIAAPQQVIGNGVTPEDGRIEIRGKKLWRAEPDVMDIAKSFYCYVPPSHIEEFLKIIEFARDVAEQTTGMPMLLQGQQQNSSDGADTLGGMQLLQNNATGVLRRLAKRFDDYLTAPHIRRYYNWLMQHSDRMDIKGDFSVDVRASSALIERDSQKQFMFAALAYAKDPQYGIDPYRLFQELTKADRMDPKRIQFNEAEYQQRINHGPTELEQAQTKLAQAKAEQAQAAAILAKVESLFSAINTANLVAANPAIAPAADATAKSAGFVDADAAPGIGIPAGGPQPSQAPSPVEGTPANTHPELPPPGTPLPMPKPPSPGSPPMSQPDVGAAAGINGGQQ